MGEGLGTRSTETLRLATGFSSHLQSRPSFPHPSLDPILFTSAERFVVWLTSPQHLRANCQKTYPDKAPIWNDVLDCLSHLRLFPRVGHLWKSDLPGPADFQAACSSEQKVFLARNIFLASEEENVLRALREGHIDAIALKGTSLAKLLHQTIASRAVSDVDLAVLPQDVFFAARILRDLGYVFQVPLELLQRRDFLLGTSVTTSEIVCTRRDACGLSQVEIHWKLFPNDRGKPWPVQTYSGLSAKTLPPTEYFFYLTSRFAAHGWVGLQQLCDIGDFFLKFQREIDWANLGELSQQAGVSRSVHISLELTDMLWGIGPYPATDPQARYCAREFLRRPFLRKLQVRPAAYHREQTSVADTWQARLRYGTQLLRPTSEDWVSKGNLRTRAGAWLARATRLTGMAVRSGELERSQ